MGSSLVHRQQDHYPVMAYLTGTCYSSSHTLISVVLVFQRLAARVRVKDRRNFGFYCMLFVFI